MVASYISIDMIPLKTPTKPLRWLGDSRERVGEFSQTARKRAGFELWEIQQGNAPSDWKPMSTVGAGVNELRVHANGEYRVLYVAKFWEAVYVLHAFTKKTQRTSKQDLEIASARFRDLLGHRRRLKQ